MVRFDVERTGNAPPGCDDYAEQQEACEWTSLVKYDNPSVLVDVNETCANSQLFLTSEVIAEIKGSVTAYGFVREYLGHNSVLMRYDPNAEAWHPAGNAAWDEELSRLRFDRRDGYCGYD